MHRSSLLAWWQCPCAELSSSLGPMTAQSKVAFCATASCKYLSRYSRMWSRGDLLSVYLWEWDWSDLCLALSGKGAAGWQVLIRSHMVFSSRWMLSNSETRAEAAGSTGKPPGQKTGRLTGWFCSVPVPDFCCIEQAFSPMSRWQNRQRPLKQKCFPPAQFFRWSTQNKSCKCTYVLF